jgi:K+-transporting ATPase KdpF subunit
MYTSELAQGVKRGCGLSTLGCRAVRRYSLSDLGHRAPREPGMSWIEWLGALLSMGLFVYLLYALLRAERF